MTYWQTYRQWLISLLNERIYLSSGGFCPELLKTAVNLRTLIINNGYRNDAKLAGFILRKQHEIIILIPLNKAHEKQLQIFKMALQQAQNNVVQDS